MDLTGCAGGGWPGLEGDIRSGLEGDIWSGLDCEDEGEEDEGGEDEGEEDEGEEVGGKGGDGSEIPPAACEGDEDNGEVGGKGGDGSEIPPAACEGDEDDTRGTDGCGRTAVERICEPPPAVDVSMCCREPVSTSFSPAGSTNSLKWRRKSTPMMGK